MDGVSSAIDWVKDNANILIPIVAGLTGVFVAYKAVSAAVAIAEAVKTAMHGNWRDDNHRNDSCNMGAQCGYGCADQSDFSGCGSSRRD